MLGFSNGSYLIMTEPPKDKNASVLLFNTDSQTDERNVARNRIEGYVVPSIWASWELGDQLREKKKKGYPLFSVERFIGVLFFFTAVAYVIEGSLRNFDWILAIDILRPLKERDSR